MDNVEYRAAIKRFGISGDDGKAVIQIVIEVPLSDRTLGTLTALGGMKRNHGRVDVRIGCPQAEMPLDDTPAATPMDDYFEQGSDAPSDAADLVKLPEVALTSTEEMAFA